jgi:hypothetical protein
MRDSIMKLTLKFKGAVIRIDTINQYDIDLKDDEISISEVHPSEVVDAVCENVPVVSTEYDYLDEVLKQACNRPVVKQVRELLHESISDNMFNGILAGVKKYLEAEIDKSRSDRDTIICFVDSDICSAMFVAAGYSYFGALDALNEHGIKSDHYLGEVFSNWRFENMVNCIDAYRPITDAIGITKKEGTEEEIAHEEETVAEKSTEEAENKEEKKYQVM